MPGPSSCLQAACAQDPCLPIERRPLSVLQAWSPRSLRGGLVGSPQCLQPSAQSPVPSRNSDLISGEEKPRDVEKTERPFFVLNPISNIVNACDKIKPLLTSKMNN